MRRAYLDHASTSPLRPAALRAMVEFLEASGAGATGDPARLHAEGLAARDTLEEARDRIAQWLGVRPRQVVLTSGATESIAAATWGARHREQRNGNSRGTGATAESGHVVCSAVEHSAVRSWAHRGPCTEVGVDGHGRVDTDELVAAVQDTTALVNLQWTNHEVATRQSVIEVASELADRPPLLHVDAAQAGAEAPEAATSGADLVSLSGHKLGAPAGIGVLVVRRNLRIPPLMVGGDQERARRAGMENIAAAVGLAAAADELAVDGRAELDRNTALTAPIIEWIERTAGVSLLGDPSQRSPHLVCMAIEGVEPQPVLLGLDQRGVAVHSGSSCSSEAFEPSPVLAAMGVDAQRSLRLSVGWSTTPADVELALRCMDEVLDDLRALGTGAR